MMRYICHMTVLLISAAVLAAGVNAVHPHGIAWYVPREALDPPLTERQRAAIVSRDYVLAAIDRGTVIIDAREASEYDKGHIPGSISVPAPKEGDPLDLEKVNSYAAADDELIVYCQGQDCQDSRNVFDLITQAGFRNVRLYADGWEDWQKAGLPVEQQVR